MSQGPETWVLTLTASIARYETQAGPAPSLHFSLPSALGADGMMLASKDPLDSENSTILLELIILICNDDSGTKRKKYLTV